MCYAWYHFQFPGIKYFVIHYLITWHCLLRTYSIVRHGFLLFCSFALHKLKMYGQLHILWDNLKFGSTMKLVLLLSHLHKSLSLQEKVEEVHWNFLIHRKSISLWIRIFFCIPTFSGFPDVHNKQGIHEIIWNEILICYKIPMQSEI